MLIPAAASLSFSFFNTLEREKTVDLHINNRFTKLDVSSFFPPTEDEME